MCYYSCFQSDKTAADGLWYFHSIVVNIEKNNNKKIEPSNKSKNQINAL